MLKNEKLAAMLTSMMTFAGVKEPPIVEGKISFTEEAEKKLRAAVTDAKYDAMIVAFNKDLADNATAVDLLAKVETMLKDLEVPQDKLEEIVNKAKSENPNDVLGAVTSLEKEMKDFMATSEEKIKKLTDAPENDNPVHSIIKDAVNAIVHNKTHVFSSGKDYDKIDVERPWNKALSEGLETSATDFSNELVVQKLNADLTHFYRENPTKIKSLHRDNFGLPEWWPKRLKVDDQVADGAIVTGEISQGRKFDFLPKNVQEIDAEIGYIFPIQIDAKWAGYDLQKIETSWLNMFNKEGSSPEKMSFVRFLVEELMKRARLEDRIATVRGIFVQTLKGATKGGRFINRQNGLFYLLWKHRDIEQKYRPFSTIEITPENVYDYYHNNDGSGIGYLYRLPEDVRNSPNLVEYIHNDVWTWYKAKYKQINGTNMDYKGLPEHFENFPNIRVESLIDHPNKQFHFMTFDDNIEILENIPSEKTAYKLQVLLREIFLMGDYKLGVRIVHVGKKWDITKPEAFKVQSVWSNDAPVFPEDTYIPIYDDTSGSVKMNYKNLMVADDWKTDIVAFEDLKPGEILKIKGNTALVAQKYVTDVASKINLTGNENFDLKSGGTLILRVGDDFQLYEISRTTTAPAAPSESVLFTGTSFDSSIAASFKYNGGSAATLASILNGFEGKKITIFGKTGAALTLTTAGSISVGSNVVLDADTKYIELVKVGSTWYKSKTNA